MDYMWILFKDKFVNYYLFYKIIIMYIREIIFYMKIKSLFGSVFKMNNKNIWISLLLVLCIFIVLYFSSFPFYEGAVDIKGAKEQAKKDKETTKKSSKEMKDKKQKEADTKKAKDIKEKETSNKASKEKVDNTISGGKEKIKKTKEDIDAKKKKLDKAKEKTE